KLAFEDSFFDVVIFGFCLYLSDPQHHFAIAAEADRTLRDGGFLVISDFCSPVPYRNRYAHHEGLYAFKMQYSNMFLWHPAYRLLSRTYFEHDEHLTLSRDEAAVVDVLHKDLANAFPQR